MASVVRFGYQNTVLTGQLSAGSQALPLGGLQNQIGSPAMAWQTAAGVVTSAAGAWIRGYTPTSVLLDAPVAYFFEGLRQSPEGEIAPARVEALSLELARTRDGRTVAAMFPRIGDRDVRSAIAGLVRAMATPGATEQV